MLHLYFYTFLILFVFFIKFTAVQTLIPEKYFSCIKQKSMVYIDLLGNNTNKNNTPKQYFLEFDVYTVVKELQP